MSEFHNGTFATLLSHADYTANLTAIAEHQELLAGETNHQDCAGFYVQRESNSIKIDISPVFYRCACIIEADRLDHIPEEDWDSMAVYISSNDHIIPRSQDIDEFVALTQEKPELIRGFTALAPVGINRLFLRRTMGRVLDPGPLAEVSEAPHIRSAVELLGEAGINWFIQGPAAITLPYTHDTRLFI